MPVAQRKKKSKCQNHNFSLKPKHHDCYFSQTITCSFRSAQENNTKEKCLTKSKNYGTDCPIYNNDKNYATPTFILSSEKKYFEENANKLKLQHQRKVYQYTDQKTQMWAPKPRSKHNYCSVCRQNYDDYLSHIESQNHSKKIHISNFNKHIIELVENVGRNHKKAEKEPSIISTSPNHEKSSCDQIVHNLSHPRKLQKMQTVTQSTNKSVSQSYINYPPQPPFYNWNINHDINYQTPYGQPLPICSPQYQYIFYNTFLQRSSIPQIPQMSQMPQMPQIPHISQLHPYSYFNPMFHCLSSKPACIVIDDDNQ